MMIDCGGSPSDGSGSSPTTATRGSLSLDPAACFACLRSQRIGYLAVTEGALPVVVPVVYAVPADRIVLRATFEGTLRGVAGMVAALGAHEVSDDFRRGWSVGVVAALIAFGGDEPEVTAALELGLPEWGSGRGVYLGMSTERIFGRCLVERPLHG